MPAENEYQQHVAEGRGKAELPQALLLLVIALRIVPSFIFPHALWLLMVLGKIIDYISYACIPKEKAPDFSPSHPQQPKQEGRVSGQAPALCKEAQQTVLKSSSAEEIGSKAGRPKNDLFSILLAVYL